MPFKSEKIKLSPNQDRRRKLTEEQKAEIRERYATGLIGQRPLAKEYGVSRSSIQLLVNPERAEAVKNRFLEHQKEYRQSGEEWNKTMREHRRYKQELYLKGELTDVSDS